MTETRERIKTNLVHYMSEIGVNQTDLAQMLNISKGTVNNWCKGNNSPDAEKVPEICSKLGITIGQLYGDPHEWMGPDSISSSSEKRLIASFRNMNEEGQEKLIQYSEDLVASGRYIKNYQSGVDSKEA